MHILIENSNTVPNFSWQCNCEKTKKRIKRSGNACLNLNWCASCWLPCGILIENFLFSHSIAGFAAIIESGHVQQSGEPAPAVAVIESLLSRWTRLVPEADILQGSVWQTIGGQSDRDAWPEGQHACDEGNARALPNHWLGGLCGQGWAHHARHTLWRVVQREWIPLPHYPFSSDCFSLLQIYNYISDKVVGILLRARKHKLLEFEGEMLYQRRDDDVPIFLLRPIKDIRQELNAKIEDIKRGTSPAPQSTSVLLDKSAHEQKLKVNAEQKRLSKSRTPSPAVKSNAKAKSPSPVESVTPVVAAKPAEETPVTAVAPVPAPAQPAPVVVIDQPPEAAATEAAPTPAPAPEAAPEATEVAAAAAPVAPEAPVPETAATEKVEPASASQEEAVTATPTQIAEAAPAAIPAEVPTIVIEASATFVRTISVDPVVETLPDQSAAAAAPASAESA